MKKMLLPVFLVTAALLGTAPAMAQGHPSPHQKMAGQHGGGADGYKGRPAHRGAGWDRGHVRTYGPPGPVPQGMKKGHVHKASHMRPGHRLPHHFRSQRFVVQDWHGRGLKKPPHDHHWIHVGGKDYVLAGLATGVVLQVLLGN